MRSPSDRANDSGNVQPSSPAMLSSKNLVMAAWPSMRPQAGSMNTASSVKKPSATADHGISPRSARPRSST